MAFSVTSSGQFLVNATTKALNSTQTSMLSQKFSAYQTYKVNIPMLNTYVKSQGNNMSNITLQFGSEHNWTLSIKEHEIRSENYLLGIQTQNGTVLHRKGECNTYKGFLTSDPTQRARLLISKNSIRGSILENGVMYMIEPLSSYLGTEANANQDIIVYKRKDAYIDPLGCITETDFGTGGNPPLQDREDCEHPDCSAYGFPDVERHMELAIETDCEFVDKYGGSDGARIEIEFRVLELDAYYSEAANLRVYLVYANLWDCNGNNSNDPYSGNDMRQHWDLVRAYWNNNMTWVQRDAVHFFSGKNLSPGNGTAKGFGGFTGSSSICGRDNDLVSPPHFTDYRHESYTVSDGLSGFHTFAHEIGHILGMGHSCDCDLMHASSSCSPPIPDCTPSDCMSHSSTLSSQYRLCLILNGPNGNWGYPQDACLQSPPPTSPDFDIMITRPNGSTVQDNGVICAGEVINVSFTNTFNNYGATWSLGPGLAFVTPPTGTVVQVATTSNGPLTSYIRGSFSYNGANFVFERNVHIGVPLPVGPPIISSSYVFPTGTVFSVGFPMPPGANFIEYSYTVTIPNQPSNYYSGTTTNANPLATGLPSNACVSFHLYPGNGCGTNYNPPYPSIDICFTLPNPIVASPDGNNILEAEQVAMKPGPIGLAETEGGISIYPNPSNQKFFVSIPNPSNSLNIKVFDANGRTVYQSNFEDISTLLEINAAVWPSGVYWLQAVQGDFAKQVKLIVKH